MNNLCFALEVSFCVSCSQHPYNQYNQLLDLREEVMFYMYQVSIFHSGIRKGM